MKIEGCLRDVPPDMPKGWLVRVLDAEQRYWIEIVRGSKLTFGQVMQLPLQQREAIWAQQVVHTPAKQLAAPDSRSSQAGDRPSLLKQVNEFCVQVNKGHCPRGKRCERQHHCNWRTDSGVGELRLSATAPMRLLTMTRS